MEIIAGSTQNFVEFFLADSSAVDGGGLIGLLHNSSGLKVSAYKSGTPTVTPLTLQAMTVGTWVDSGFIEIDDTLIPGRYQLGVPNALVATEGILNLDVWGAVNLVYTPLRIVVRRSIIPSLKRNQAFTAMPFVMISSATRLPLSGLTVTVERMIDTGASAVGTLTNIVDKGAGRYTVDGLAADANGNYITFTCTASGAVPTIFTMITVP